MGSPLYAGDQTMYNEFRNRDRRLYFTVVPPYKVKVGSPNYTWTKTTVASEAEYVDFYRYRKTATCIPMERNNGYGNGDQHVASF